MIQIPEAASLDVPYSERDLQRSVDFRVARVTGLELKPLRQLTREMYSDLDVERFGFRWWINQVPTQLRILLSDYLYSLTTEVAQNLLEGLLHVVEYAQLREEQRSRAVRALLDVTNPERFAPSTPRDELILFQQDMHLAGFFRALAAALDCLAGALIGVLALPIPIQRADWAQLQKLADGQPAAVASVLQSAQMNVLRECIASTTAGPSEWLRWALSIRNMYAHRGRHMGISSLQASGGEIEVPSWQPPPEVVSFLPRSPLRTHVEAIAKTDSLTGFLLTEDATTSVRGSLSEAVRTAEDVSSRLTSFWIERRTHPDWIVQPALRQWRPDEDVNFEGFAPNSKIPQLSAVMLHPELAHRLRAAALLDPHRHVIWRNNHAD